MAQAILGRPPVVPLVPADTTDTRTALLRFASAINQILRGTIGATMGVTLVAGETTSSFGDTRIGPYSSVSLMPQTGHAADILPSIWIETNKGSVIIHHGIVPYDDCTYVALLLG